MAQRNWINHSIGMSTQLSCYSYMCVIHHSVHNMSEVNVQLLQSYLSVNTAEMCEVSVTHIKLMIAVHGLISPHLKSGLLFSSSRCWRSSAGVLPCLLIQWSQHICACDVSPRSVLLHNRLEGLEDVLKKMKLSSHSAISSEGVWASAGRSTGVN